MKALVLGIVANLLLIPMSTGSALTRRPATQYAPLPAIDRGGGEDPSPHVAVPKSKNGLLLAPGATKKLKVKVTDTSGRPLAGASILFVAPARGASGTFRGATPATATFLRVATNAKGVASATFTANSTPGVYLVDVIVEETDAATSFAMTNTTAGPPALAPNRARLTVLSQLFPDTVEDETFRIHGPVLVGPGATVASAGLADTVFPTSPFVVERPMWLFWVDDDPLMRFGHPTAFVLLDAADTTPNVQTEARVTREGWWPVVTGAGGGSLQSPYFANEAESPAAADLVSASSSERGPGPPADACAILVHGRGVGGFLDVRNMAQFLRDANLVESGNIMTTGDPFDGAPRPATRADLQMFVNDAKRDGCRKVYVYISSHGSAGGLFSPGSVVLSGPETPDGIADDSVTYDDLAALLEPLRGTELCVMIDACFSGQACEFFRGRGFTGTFVSASDRDHVAYAIPLSLRRGKIGGYYTTALLDCWADRAGSDTNQDGMVTLAEAHEGVLRKFAGRPSVVGPKPKSMPIRPDGPAYFYLPDAVHPNRDETFTVVLYRPKDIPLGHDFTATLTIADPGIALFGPQGSSGAQITVTLPAGTPSAPVNFYGLKEDVTSYTIEGRDTTAEREYTGTGRVLIGIDYVATPDPAVIKLGGTSNTIRVKIRRRGPIAQVRREVRLHLIARDETIARPVLTSVVFPPGAEMVEVTIEGLKNGATKIDVRDYVHGAFTDIDVVVMDPKCLTTGASFLNFTVDTDVAQHDLTLMLRQALVVLDVADGRVNVVSNHALVVPAMGKLDEANCTLPLAEGTGTIAGFPNVKCEYQNVHLTLEGDGTMMVRGKYELGVGRELPTGESITYDFSGVLILPDPKARER